MQKISTYRRVTLACLAFAVVGCQHVRPTSNLVPHRKSTRTQTSTPEATPDFQASRAYATPTADPIDEMTTSPAPLINFDGDVYFMISSDEYHGTKVLEFLRDGDKRETAKRMLRVRFEPIKNLRAHEKAFLAQHPGADRQLHYRSAHRLSHSILTDGLEGPTLTMMEWRMHHNGLVSCELIVHQNTPNLAAVPTPAPTPAAAPKPSKPAKGAKAAGPEGEPAPKRISSPSFDALIKQKYQIWQTELIAVYNQTPALLREPAEPAARILPPLTPSPTPAHRKA